MGCNCGGSTPRTAPVMRRPAAGDRQQQREAQKAPAPRRDFKKDYYWNGPDRPPGTPNE